MGGEEGGEEGVELLGQEGFVQGVSCPIQELEHMLESICEYLPISGAELDLVADTHSRFHPKLERSGAIKNQGPNW